VNERVALRLQSGRASVSSGLDSGILKGDWTRANTTEHNRSFAAFGSEGNLYLFYHRNAGGQHLLPQLLTTGVVLDEIKTQSGRYQPSMKGA